MDINSFIAGLQAGQESAPPAGGGGSMDGFHMVRFFNDDRATVLYTVFVPTGSTAFYSGETPLSTVSEINVFMGFEPSPVNITGDMDCFAVYDENVPLDLAPWSVIAKHSESGDAQNYYAVGDTKTIHIEGMVGTLELNADYLVYIIGFDHNEDIEGKGITFGTFKRPYTNSNVCLYVDATSSGGQKNFNMNHWGNYNYGGWAGSDIRYDVLGSTDVAPSNYGAVKTAGVVGYDATATCATQPVPNTLMSALPSDLRKVMKPMTIYTDNVGGKGGKPESVTPSIDYLPLLSCFEVCATYGWGNPTEKAFQAQYEYFASGNSALKYRHDTGASGYWWLRTHYKDSEANFLDITSSGTWQAYSANRSWGLAPIFRV